MADQQIALGDIFKQFSKAVVERFEDDLPSLLRDAVREKFKDEPAYMSARAPFYHDADGIEGAWICLELDFDGSGRIDKGAQKIFRVRDAIITKATFPDEPISHDIIRDLIAAVRKEMDELEAEYSIA